jgi:MFS family permease
VADDPRGASWRLVAALGVTQIVSWGTLYYAFSLMIDAFAGAAHIARSGVVGAFSVALLVTGLASAPVGRLIDRHGGRAVMTAGSVAGAALLAALACVTSAWQLYAAWALLGLVMAATLYDPAFAVLVQVFKDRQRKAITALTLFGGFASTVFWPLTQVLVQRFGWQDALLALGAINLLVCVPLHWWVLPGAPGIAPEVKEQRSHDKAAPIFDATFFGLCAAFTGNALVFSAMSVHLIPLLQGKGLSASQAAWVGAMIGPMQVLGRILEYTLLSRWSPSRVGSLAMWLLPISLGLLALAVPQSAVMAIFALLYGMGNGVMTIVRGATPAELYGRERYGAINGAMATPVLIAKAAGPISASLLLAATASAPRLLLGLAAIGAGSAVLFTSTVHRRRAGTPSIPQQAPQP